jgi:hypothetical protein
MNAVNNMKTRNPTGAFNSKLSNGDSAHTELCMIQTVNAIKRQKDSLSQLIGSSRDRFYAIRVVRAISPKPEVCAIDTPKADNVGVLR